MLPGVDLAGIVKNKQHLDILPGEGPRNVIFSVDAAAAEVTEAFQEISLATPGSESEPGLLLEPKIKILLSIRDFLKKHIDLLRKSEHKKMITFV